ncbi:MAG: NADH-quinone oxidoreductase subunit NuoH [Candidatus Hadarchaeaceae archaeon]
MSGIAVPWPISVIIEPEVFIPLIYPGLLVLTLSLLGIIWLERKLTAKVQRRYGPLYVVRMAGGVLQPLADGVKFIFSEQIIPRRVYKLVFIFGPILLMTFSVLPVIGMPLSPAYAAITSDVSLLLVLALVVLAPMVLIMVAWGSNNKFSLIGGLREGYLMISYEVPIILSLLAMAALYNSLNLVEITQAQAGVWGIFLNPLAAIVLFIGILIATGRFPFEIGEAETEIVAGWTTEYGSSLYIMNMATSYTRKYVMAHLFTLVFLGGWNPLPSFIPASGPFPGLMLFLKSMTVMALMVFFRSIYPRFRVDQGVRIGWHKLFILSMAAIVLSFLLVTLGVWGRTA